MHLLAPILGDSRVAVGAGIKAIQTADLLRYQEPLLRFSENSAHSKATLPHNLVWERVPYGTIGGK